MKYSQNRIRSVLENRAAAEEDSEYRQILYMCRYFILPKKDQTLEILWDMASEDASNMHVYLEIIGLVKRYNM